MPYKAQHLATGLGGIGQSTIGRGARPYLPCGLCGRLRSVSNETKAKGISFCADCRVQEPELTAKWEANHASHR